MGNVQKFKYDKKIMLNLCMHYALANMFAEVLPEKQEEYALITINHNAVRNKYSYCYYYSNIFYDVWSF